MREREKEERGGMGIKRVLEKKVRSDYQFFITCIWVTRPDVEGNHTPTRTCPKSCIYRPMSRISQVKDAKCGRLQPIGPVQFAD